MPQFKLRRIHIRNWMTIQEQTLDFPSRGLVFVSGVNSTTQFESIGSGKTSLGEALSIAITGVRGRHASVGHYSRNDKGNTLIRVEGTLGNEELAVEMGYKCKELSRTGEGLRFTLGGQTISRSHVDLTRQELGLTLGITPEVASWSVYIDGDKLDFSSMSQTASVELLMAALGQPSWSAYHDRTKKTLAQLVTDVKTKTAAKETIEGLIEETASAIDQARMSVETAKKEFEFQKKCVATKLKETTDKKEALQAKVREREKQRKEIKAKIKAIEDELASQFKTLEVEDLRLKSEKTAITNEKKPLVAQERAIHGEHTHLELALRSLKLKPKECPTCKKPWDRGPSTEDIHTAENKVAESTVALKALQTTIQEIVSREEAKQAEIDAIQRKQREINVRDRIRTMAEQLDALDTGDRHSNNEILTYTTLIANLEKGPSDRDVVRASSVLDGKLQAMSEYSLKQEGLATDVDESAELCKIVEYWAGAFGPSGIPNLVLSRSVEPLNQVSTALSHRMSGGTLSISYETVKELASGLGKNSLNIKVKNSRGATRMAGNSKGESGLTNLIVAETITEVGRVSSRVGFRWYDEVVNSQDQKVRRCILTYLKETAHRLGILIFVVDHHPEVSAFADHILRAEKNAEGVTSFKWV